MIKTPIYNPALRLVATTNIFDLEASVAHEVMDQNAGTVVATVIYKYLQVHVSPMILLRPEATETRLQSFNKFDQTLHCLCKGAFPLALPGCKITVVGPRFPATKFNITSNETTSQTRLRIERVLPQ